MYPTVFRLQSHCSAVDTFQHRFYSFYFNLFILFQSTTHSVYELFIGLLMCNYIAICHHISVSYYLINCFVLCMKIFFEANKDHYYHYIIKLSSLMTVYLQVIYKL